MQAARKVESFCVDPSERWMFTGNLSGLIAVVDIDAFTTQGEAQAHAGTIIAMAAHPHLPYVACLGLDRMLSVWAYDDRARLRPVCAASIRNVRPKNDVVDFVDVYSNAQTLGFHDQRRRLVTRTGSGGVLELDFDDDGRVQLVRCTRLHGDLDVITARYVRDSDMVLSGSGGGELVLSDHGAVVRRWQIKQHSIHWVEHVAGTGYLVASDSRVCARVDIADGNLVIGPPFARDDFEHVTYNPTSGRAYASSFDRAVYELDPSTCAVKGVVFRAPFKCRWVHALRREPSVLLVQCRDGGIHKVDVDEGRSLRVIRDTPEALWTGLATPDGSLLLAGEGATLTRLRVVGVDRMALKPEFAVERTLLDIPESQYTKRMVLHSSSETVVLGRSDGDVILFDGHRARRLVNLGSAVRDLAVSTELPELFVACEDGHGYKLDLASGERLCTFTSPTNSPIWALAYNEKRDAIAFLERNGSVWVLAAHDFSPILSGVEAGRVKRAKWVDADRLLYSHGGELFELDMTTGQGRELVSHMGNTIEDFIWDHGQNYIVFICYTWTVGLADFRTGQLLCQVPDQIDYSKGLVWVPRVPACLGMAYPLDFLTFGRSGGAHHWRVHNEGLVALGPAMGRHSVSPS